MTELATTTGAEAVAQWEQRGRQLTNQATSTVWAIGDWLNDGERIHGDTYRRASEITGHSVGTLRNYAQVASRFDLSQRYDTLGFGHHALVAAIPEEAARQWLELAADNDWSYRELQAALRTVSQLPPGEPNIAAVIFKITVPADHDQRWKAAAEARGLEVTDWIITVADEAAANLKETRT
jgi:ADP-ribose pyrophosphatase YjhB (NUDIX family)